MPWIGAAISVGGSLLGGAMGADSANSAAEAGAASTAQSIAEQRRQYDLSRQDQLQQYNTARADNAGYMQNGQAGNAKLAYLLGLNPGSSPSAASSATPQQSADQIRQQLLGQFTKTTGGGEPIYGQNDNYENGTGWANGMHIPQGFSQGTTSIDEAGLQQAINQRLAQQTPGQPQGPTAAQTSAAASDPAYGSLLKKFSTSDLNADPVYQNGLKFGLDEGTGALNARAIQQGGYDSGATLKALTRFANDYGTTKAQGAYDRFNTDNTNTYNRLAGISGTGQTATSQVTGAGQNMANQNTAAGASAANSIGSSYTDAGTARAAGIVGGGNAWGNAISGATNNGSNYFRSLLTGNGSYGGTPYNANTTIPMQPGGGY